MDIQNGIVGHVGEDVNDCDNRHGDGNGQRQVPKTTTHFIYLEMILLVSVATANISCVKYRNVELTSQGF